MKVNKEQSSRLLRDVAETLASLAGQKISVKQFKALLEAKGWNLTEKEAGSLIRWAFPAYKRLNARRRLGSGYVYLLPEDFQPVSYTHLTLPTTERV